MIENKEINRLVERFLEKPYMLNMGKGSLSRKVLKATIEDVLIAKKLAKQILTEPTFDNKIKLEKSVQKYKDLNRINNKDKRSLYRVTNTLEELNSDLIGQLDILSNTLKTPTPNIQKKGSVAVVQISDTHFNELVDLPNNRYDFYIASQRLQKYADEVKQYCSIKKIKKIVIALTGDLINSDRRLDEKLSMSTNRTKATLLAVNLLEYFILDLAEIAPIDVAYVTGNESRVAEEYGNTDMVVSDNYDVIIFNMLRLLFRKSTYVNFLESNPVETVLNINGLNLLMLHGTTLGGDTQKKIQQVIGKYSAKGVVIDYTIFGHVHFANVTDLYARSGSLVGNNAYSDYGLNLATKASQNLHFISENKELQNIRIELDKTTGYEGYPIKNDVDAYNAKSASKLYQKHSIIEIVI